MQAQSFGYWLKLRRKALDLTQAELANQVGCSAAAIRKIEAEERRPSAQIVERLGKILNIPSNEQTSFLHFARGELFSAPAETENFPWQSSTRSIPSNLPATVTSLIGREQEIALIREYLLDSTIRLVSLIGPPGIGKTRLSIEAAQAAMPLFPNGVFFVALAPLDDPSLLGITVIQALGFVERKLQSASDQLIEGIGDQQILIVLDNCEHVIEAVAGFATTLLSACPRLKLIATSRESLRISGEWIYTIPALDIPKESTRLDMTSASEFHALRLFAERARAVRSDFRLHADNIQDVASICAQLDGLPLAIELIAARMRLMSPRVLRERLNDQFILSADGMRSSTERQKTLNNAIGWSYNLLSEEEQRLFGRLSVFSGDFALEAAETIFSELVGEKSVSDLIALLLDKSLLQRIPDERGGFRFTMLVTIHQFARERLLRTGEEARIRNLHLAYFLDLAKQADREIHGSDQAAWMDRLDVELDNFRAALDWSLSSEQTEKLLMLFAALGWVWMVRWSPSESRAWLDKIRALPDFLEYPMLYAQTLNNAVHQEWIAGNFGDALSFVEESQRIWRKLGTHGERGLAEAFYLIGMIAMSEVNYSEAATYLDQSFELYEKCDNKWGMAFARFLSGHMAKEQAEYPLALAWLKQSMDIFNELGDPWGMARSAQRLGELFLTQENYEKARFYLEQHLSLDEGLLFKQGIAVALLNLGSLYRHQQDYDRAEYFFTKSMAMCREYGLSQVDRGSNLYSLGMLALHRNQYALGAERFRDYFNSFREISEIITVCDSLAGFAAVAAGMNQPERSATLWGAAQARLEATNYRIEPFDHAELDRHIQIARDRLGEATFDAIAAKAYSMTMEEAVAFALENGNE